MREIMGIDQSITHTAVVILDEDTLKMKSFKVIKTKNRNGRDGEEFSYTQRIISIRDIVKNTIEKEKNIRLCAIEGLSLNKNSKTARPLAGLFYMLTSLFTDREVPYHVIPPASVKKTAHSGNASKEEVFAALPEEISEAFIEAGYKKTTGLFDLSDAYFIAITAINKIRNN